MAYTQEDKEANGDQHYYNEEEQCTTGAPSGLPPPSPPSPGTSLEWHSTTSPSMPQPLPAPCSGTRLEWHIKSYTVGSKKPGKRKTILRDIGTGPSGLCVSLIFPR
jgi:hypothetical protein